MAIIMKYKLIAFDVDDTLLNTKKEITPRTEAALLNAQKNGALLTVASGRLPYGVRPFAKKLKIFENNGYYMGYNGGAIMNSRDELIGRTYLDPKYIEPVYSLLRPTNITVIVSIGAKIYADRKVNAYTHIEPDVIGLPLNLVDDIADFVDTDINKLLLCGEPDELLRTEAVLKKSFAGELDIYFSAPWFLEVMPKGIDKGRGLECICRDCGIDISETVAFGDSFNDIPMLKAAGVGVAMGNAEQKVKEAADLITADCDSDGIAEALKKLGL